ncbi:MAG: NADH-quinone oxidoreductase subunit L [Bdellovibrionota bacterium]
MTSNVYLALWIPLFPLIAYFVQVSVGKKLPRMGDWVSTGAIFVSFLLATKIFFSMFSNFSPDWVEAWSFTWIDLGSVTSPFKIDLGVRIDNISAIMLFMVTGCSTLIHLFSTGYMRDHDGKESDGYRYASFFAYLSLFTAAMLGLIISDNLFSLFMCWEVMGLCSYLLIGFYRNKVSAANASIKAFMTTRVGDTGLFIAMLMLFTLPLADGQALGSFRFEDIYNAIAAGRFNFNIGAFSAATVMGLLVFCGTVGKSAQFPLQVWLPDAMEGPTPVSALIHAATMVAAGVYLILRMFPLLEAGNVLIVVAYVGSFTALFAAILAIKQNDIKKVLAYSTLSQLGYMVMAIGLGAYQASFMHLITHALFKACLFMSSGAVIYAMHHEQDMRHMGGLKKKLPITFACMFVATLAISGVPFFSGFVSKDKILAASYAFGVLDHPVHFFLPFAGFLTAGLTSFYMFRLIFMTFFGKPHDEHHYDHAHEVPPNMFIPLIALASLSLAVLFSGSLTGGLLGHADFILGGANNWFEGLVTNSGFVHGHGAEWEEHLHHAHIPAMILSLIVAGLGILSSYLVFGSKKISAEKLSTMWPSFVHKAIDNLYFFDWFYIKVLIQKGFLPFSAANAKFDDSVIDQGAVDGIKNITMVTKDVAGAVIDDAIIDGFLVDKGAGGVTALLGGQLQVLQNGRIQRYLLVAVGVLSLVLIWRGL